MRLTKEFKLDVGISILLLAIFLFIVSLFTGCSDNGDHYNTPQADYVLISNDDTVYRVPVTLLRLKADEYPLNKWRQQHEQATVNNDVAGNIDITYNFWHH